MSMDNYYNFDTWNQLHNKPSQHAEGLPTYATVKKSQLDEFDTHYRVKLEAAILILYPVLTVEMKEDLWRHIDRECELQERRLANLRQAQRAMEELRTRIGYEETIRLDFDTGRITHTPIGNFWIALRGLLEEFWTA